MMKTGGKNVAIVRVYLKERMRRKELTIEKKKRACNDENDNKRKVIKTTRK